MVSNCANPACSATFRYLYDGQLFHLPVQPAPGRVGDPGPSSTLESFWLCTECSRKMTLVAGPDGVMLAPRQDVSKPRHADPAPGGRSRQHDYHSR
jgi:hypothetical protein